MTGETETFNRGYPIRVHSKIDCLKFDEGNKAIASGPITQSSDPEVAAVGLIAVFGIEDNGEGENAPPDRITSVEVYAPEEGIDCNDLTFVGDELQKSGEVVNVLNPILAGNIQVKP